MSVQFFDLPEIDVKTVADYLQKPTQEVQLIDVREPQELAIASIDGFVNYPLSEHQQWSESILTQLDLHKETWVMCHHGRRSAQMGQWLIQQGFTNVKNITGGIDAYSVIVDDTVPRY